MDTQNHPQGPLGSGVTQGQKPWWPNQGIPKPWAKTGGSKGPEEGVGGGTEKSGEQGQDLRQEGPGRTELLQGRAAWRPRGHLASPGMRAEPGK